MSVPRRRIVRILDGPAPHLRMSRAGVVTLLLCSVLAVAAFVQVGAVETAQGEGVPSKADAPTVAKDELGSGAWSGVITYEVNKRVSDFPEEDDFSTPESAYAAIGRVMASGGSNADWDRVSGRKPPVEPGVRYYVKREMPPERAKMWGEALIREVNVYLGKAARVFAEVRTESGEVKYDQRSVVLKNGLWFNQGQDGLVDSLEDARAIFERKKGRLYPFEKPVRPGVQDPVAHLAAFVEFLQEEAKEPKAFVLDALAQHKVVLMGETHHRPRYWALNTSLIEDPGFADTVGVVYLELPLNDQPLVDEFLAADELDTAPVIQMLRDMLWMGWPDQPMLDFFVKVWETNQELPGERQIRVVLVDMQRPWSKIERREDWAQYNVDRDKLMAENVVQDLREHSQDERNALFIVGCGHAHLRLTYGDKRTIAPSAGSYLYEELGREQVYSILQHGPAMANMGRVHGRVTLGLFDSAFAALDHKPLAFSLETGPFGEEPFDRFPDEAYMIGTYRDGYSAYVYLCPLEDEVFSPLIPGFYTEEHMKEIDRRFRMMNGKPWHESYRREKTDAESFVAWMSGPGGSWGQPRSWTSQLGPMDAWKLGDNWQQEARKEKLAAKTGPENQRQSVAEVKAAELPPEPLRNEYLEIPANDVENCSVIWFSSGKGFVPKTDDELIAKLNSFLTRKVSRDQAIFRKEDSTISAWLIVADVFQKNEIKEVLKREESLSGPQVERLDTRFYQVFKAQKMADRVQRGQG